MEIFDRRRLKLAELLREMSAAELSRKSGVAASYISSCLKDPSDKWHKTIGELTARKLEAGARKPERWMDDLQQITTPLPAVYQPNAPIPLAGRAGGAITLDAAIDALRGHIRASGANKDAVAALLAAVGKDPDDESAAAALHTILNTAFAQAGAKVA